MREAEYFSAIGLQFTYESYPGQPFAEFTAQSCADRRDWIVGTPDDAIAWIEQKQEETGGFGGLMLTTHEWRTAPSLPARSRCSRATSCPHFRGHTATYHDEWRRIREGFDPGVKSTAAE